MNQINVVAKFYGPKKMSHGGFPNIQSKEYRLISSPKGLLFSPVLEICKLQTIIFDESSVECVLSDSGVVHNSRLLGWVQLQQWDEVVC